MPSCSTPTDIESTSLATTTLLLSPFRFFTSLRHSLFGHTNFFLCLFFYLLFHISSSFSSALSHLPRFSKSQTHQYSLPPSLTLLYTSLYLIAGLAHNFAGSTSALGYSSVMDYPSALVHLDKNGKLALEIGKYRAVQCSAVQLSTYDAVQYNTEHTTHCGMKQVI